MAGLALQLIGRRFVPRVGLDLRGTEQGFKAHFGRGTGRYAEELARHLLQSAQNDISVIGLRSPELSGSRLEKSIIRAIPFGKVSLETQFFLPNRVSRARLDLMHFVAHGDAPARLKTPYIVTVLDLIPLRFAELYRAERPGWRFNLARSLELQAIKGAAGIIAISDATKRDIVELLGAAPERIAVTHLAVDRSRFVSAGSVPNVETREALRQDLSLPLDRPLILYVGGIDPRKNVPFLLRMLEALIQRGKVRPHLVMVGGIANDKQFPALQAQIREARLENDISFAGHVSDADLVKYYQAVDVMVYPSLYEGFGLPVLEAMTAGCPVIAGRNSSLPEVSGSRYPLFRDNDIGAWVEGVESLLLDFGRREELRSEGLSRSGEFSWERTANATLNAYREFLSRPK